MSKASATKKKKKQLVAWFKWHGRVPALSSNPVPPKNKKNFI
jgi:hypothetical protein